MDRETADAIVGAKANSLAVQALLVGLAVALYKRGQLDPDVLKEAFEFADNAAIGAAGNENLAGLSNQGAQTLRVLEGLRKALSEQMRPHDPPEGVIDGGSG